MTTWTQLPLFAGDPTPTTLTLRIGLLLPDHAQWQVEARHAATSELLSMSSRHHFDPAYWMPEFQRASGVLADLIGEMIDPF